MTQRYRGERDLADRLAYVANFLADRLQDSEQQLAKESGAGHAYYTGRVDAFRLAIEELREVVQ